MKMCVSEPQSDPELSTLFIGVGLFVWLHCRVLAACLQRLASAEVCVCISVCDMKY